MTTTLAGADPTAVVGKRYLAAFIDWLLGAAIGFGTFLVLADSYSSSRFGNPCAYVDQPNACYYINGDVHVVEGGKAFVYYGVIIVWAIAIYWVLRGLTGKTPGTAMLGLVCVDEQGRPPGLLKAVLRSVAGIVDYIPCCFPIVGLVTIATTKGHRRVGDMAASTYMIDKAYAGQQVRLDPGPGASMGAYGVAAGAPPVGPGTPQAPWGSAQPQWDAQRNAYVQWDQASGRWLQFDQATNQWRPIDGA